MLDWSAARYQTAGAAVATAAVGWYVLGPTLVDPHGDGLWYGALTLVAGILLGYGLALDASDD